MLNELRKQRPHNEKIILTIFSLLGVPQSMIDLGCGDNTMVKVARGLGVDAIGVDILPTADVVHDLTQPLDINGIYDLVLCLEMAEHLPLEAAKQLIVNLNLHSHNNSRLVFSAAMPGQGGNGHLNEQPPRYWRDLLYSTGRWSLREDLTAQLKLLLTYTAGPAANWLVPNIQVF